METKQQSIGLSNLTIVQYASIGTQVKFIDTIKYYEQSLSSRAKNANDVEKTNTRQTCRKFMENNATYSLIFYSLSDKNTNWVWAICVEEGELFPMKR